MTNAQHVRKNLKWKKQRRRKRFRRRERPTLRFTPYSWSKLLYLRDAGNTEVGGFGLSSAADLLLIEDIRLVDQRCTAVTVKFDDAGVADFFDEQVDQGQKPEQFSRIWIHTHPVDCPLPSLTDEDTFGRCFGAVDWAVMFILAKSGATYVRQQFNVGPGGAHRMRTEVDFDCEFTGPNSAVWHAEYDQHVQLMDPFHDSVTNLVPLCSDGADTDHSHMSDVIDEWYLRAEAVDLFPDMAEEDESWNQYLAAVD